MLLSNIFNL